jgi:5-methyltetrahydrofolate--homocysteine methyltransferase
MERGELILPFVLESAEVMKAAINYLEGYMDKSNSHIHGTVVLATVFGDVHDIGKNLVKTIIANNGYRVIDLGKQVSAEEIVSRAIQEKADAIALSALLVTTSKQMAAVVESLHSKGVAIPLIVGGAAINEAFAKHISSPRGERYAGGVYYAKDAFAGLRILEGLK